MSITSEAREVLLQLTQVIQDLTRDEYTEKLSALSHASIGEHTRHIIELFQQLLSGYEPGVVDYDDRKRNQRIEVEIDFATEQIAHIISALGKADKSLQILSVYSKDAGFISSSYTRELMYNIEHCIHHQAIIKIGLLCLEKQVTDENFGVAKSTVLFRSHVHR